MKKTISLFVFLAVILLTGLACSLPFAQKDGGSFSASSGSSIGPIQFCADVTDDGDCLGEGSRFPAGTGTVWAFFTYQDMRDGQPWSLVWEQDGDLYQRDDLTWEDGEEGWLAYSLEEPNLSGTFDLTILLDGEAIQSASFSVDESEAAPETAPPAGQGGAPAFGPITIASDVSDNNFPIGITSVFPAGTQAVYAVFPYANMSAGMDYTVEWVVNDLTVSREDNAWESQTNGMYYCSLYDDEPLPEGDYILLLYINQEVQQYAKFTVQGEAAPEPPPQPIIPNRPATPEEVVDPQALPYFYEIFNADLPVLHEIVAINLQYWTEIIVTDDSPCGENAIACFYKENCDVREGGKVYMTSSAMNDPSAEVTATLVHELTHGMQFYLGMPCGCTVEKEYYALISEVDYLLYSGNEDYAYDHYGRAWDDSGAVRPDIIWDVVKAAYGDHCPDY